jgi:hypothetical protein
MNPLKDVVQECLRKSETAIEIKDVMTSNHQPLSLDPALSARRHNPTSNIPTGLHSFDSVGSIRLLSFGPQAARSARGECR